MFTTHKKRTIVLLSALATIMAMAFVLTSCGSKGNAVTDNPYKGGTAADLSGYKSMRDYTGENMLVETTVAEAEENIKSGKSFVLFMSYADCPYCNRLIPYLNEAAVEQGVYIGYIDTRKDPSWQSNMDIDDYDVFVKRFDKYLEDDEDGKKHLYTPDTYFIKNGKVVARHDGVTPGADDPSHPLTASQEERLREDLANEFASIK